VSALGLIGAGKVYVITAGAGPYKFNVEVVAIGCCHCGMSLKISCCGKKKFIF
jgi:hypothetical protein